MIELSKKERGRILSKVTIDFKDPEKGCWNYNGYLSDGYGRIYWQGKRYKAHRFFYEMIAGNIPIWTGKESLEIDHLCKNRACVNFKHLALVTPKINTLRGNGVGAKNAQKDQCVHGHDAFYKIGNRRRCKDCCYFVSVLKCRRMFDASEKRELWRKARNSL